MDNNIGHGEEGPQVDLRTLGRRGRTRATSGLPTGQFNFDHALYTGIDGFKQRRGKSRSREARDPPQSNRSTSLRGRPTLADATLADTSDAEQPGDEDEEPEPEDKEGIDYWPSGSVEKDEISTYSDDEDDRETSGISRVRPRALSFEARSQSSPQQAPRGSSVLASPVAVGERKSKKRQPRVSFSLPTDEREPNNSTRGNGNELETGAAAADEQEEGGDSMRRVPPNPKQGEEPDEFDKSDEEFDQLCRAWEGNPKEATPERQAADKTPTSAHISRSKAKKRPTVETAQGDDPVAGQDKEKERERERRATEDEQRKLKEADVRKKEALAKKRQEAEAEAERAAHEEELRAAKTKAAADKSQRDAETGTETSRAAETLRREREEKQRREDKEGRKRAADLEKMRLEAQKEKKKRAEVEQEMEKMKKALHAQEQKVADAKKNMEDLTAATAEQVKSREAALKKAESKMKQMELSGQELVEKAKKVVEAKRKKASEAEAKLKEAMALLDRAKQEKEYNRYFDKLANGRLEEGELEEDETEEDFSDEKVYKRKSPREMKRKVAELAQMFNVEGPQEMLEIWKQVNGIFGKSTRGPSTPKRKRGRTSSGSTQGQVSPKSPGRKKQKVLSPSPRALGKSLWHLVHLSLDSIFWLTQEA
ncbi:hypothetical protein BDZ89DRAFT_1136089 [Hymenopellis radicata]|nr:hypothetical protein BDZ89DRAFT_1136089 [Hymenopellis radicata]